MREIGRIYRQGDKDAPKYYGRDHVHLFIRADAVQTDADKQAEEQFERFSKLLKEHTRLSDFGFELFLLKVEDPEEYERYYERSLPVLRNGSLWIGIEEITEYVDDYQRFAEEPDFI